MKRKKAAFCILFCFLCFTQGLQKTFSFEKALHKVLTSQTLQLPKNVADNILKNKELFFKDLKKVLSSNEKDILILVDKKHLLDKDYKPKSLVLLNSPSSVIYTFNNNEKHTLLIISSPRAYVVNKHNISLAKIAENALQKMAVAAKKEGITLTVSSAYRTYQYQKNLFNSYVKKYGEKEAETFSARAGSSQHQLGTVIDFGSISDSYAETREGKWLYKNASKYGWSLSYPKSFEKVTGYKWECWHYRYLGVEACSLQKNWFNDIQQYMLEFIHVWRLEEDSLLFKKSSK